MTRFVVILMLMCTTVALHSAHESSHVYSTDVQIDIHSPTKITKTVKKKYLILSEDDEIGTWSHSYDGFIKVSNIEARFASLAGKKIKTLKRKDATDKMAYDGFSIASDSRVISMDLYHHSYPYILETEVTKVYSSLVYISSSVIQSYDQQVDAYTFQIVSHDPEVIPEIRCHNLKDDTCNQAQSGTDISYAFSNLEPISYESYGPSYWEILPRLTISFSDFTYGAYQGDHTSWESFGTFIAALNDGRQDLPSDLVYTIDTLTEGLDLRSQVHSVYRYLQDHHRYVSIQLGVGGWQTYDVKDVHDTGSGDCKALSNYMVSALQYLGIDAHYSLIYTKDHLNYPEEYFANRFNHAVVYVPSLDEWYECTSSASPAGYLGADNYDKTVLSVVNGKGVRTRTSEWDYSKNTETESVVVKLEADGSAMIDASLSYRGSRSEHWNSVKHYLRGDKLHDHVKERLLSTSSKMDDPQIIASRASPHVQLKVTAESILYAKSSGDRLFVPVNEFFTTDHRLDAAIERKQDLIIREGYIGDLTITIDLPPDYDIESMDEGTTIDSPYGTLSSSLTVGEGKVTFERKLTKYPVHVQASDYSAVKEFYQKLYTADSPMIVLVRKRT